MKCWRTVWAVAWRVMAILVWIMILEACCRFCKPAVRPPIEIIHYPQDCLEGPPPPLMALARVTDGCPEGHACYSPAEIVILARWIEEIAEWSRDAVTLCGIKENDHETNDPD